MPAPVSPVMVDLLGGSSATITKAAGTTTAVNVPGGGAMRWALHLKYEGTAGDGGDSYIPILQTSVDGTLWQDVASTAAIAGGVVTAVNEFVEALTPKASARIAASAAALAASTINSTFLGPKVRLNGAFTDADNDGSWTVSVARLLIFE